MNITKTVHLKREQAISKSVLIPFPAPNPEVLTEQGYWNNKTFQHDFPTMKFIFPSKEFFFARFVTLVNFRFCPDKADILRGLYKPPLLLTKLMWNLTPDEFEIEFLKLYDNFNKDTDKVAFMLFDIIDPQE